MKQFLKNSQLRRAMFYAPLPPDSAFGDSHLPTTFLPIPLNLATEFAPYHLSPSDRLVPLAPMLPPNMGIDPSETIFSAPPSNVSHDMTDQRLLEASISALITQGHLPSTSERAVGRRSATGSTDVATVTTIEETQAAGKAAVAKIVDGIAEKRLLAQELRAVGRKRAIAEAAAEVEAGFEATEEPYSSLVHPTNPSLTPVASYPLRPCQSYAAYHIKSTDVPTRGSLLVTDEQILARRTGMKTSHAHQFRCPEVTEALNEGRARRREYGAGREGRLTLVPTYRRYVIMMRDGEAQFMPVTQSGSIERTAPTRDTAIVNVCEPVPESGDGISMNAFII